MKTEVMAWFDMDAPVFAFSHCPDVVAAVSHHGGLGTFGTSRIPVEQIERDLKWLASHCADRPIGFDVVFPSNAPHEFERMSADEIASRIPATHFEFVDELLRSNGLVPCTPRERKMLIEAYVDDRLRTHVQSERRLELAFAQKNVKLIVSALGVPPPRQIERAHELGMKVAALVGHPKHVRRQLDAGVDILIATGYEAGGHTGEIAGMVLTPQVVEAAGSVPVLHAGGVARGSQIAAALALGAQAVWTGSLWLGTAESETTPAVKDILFNATSGDTVRTRARSGKPVRHVRTGFVQAWEADHAPKPLPTPVQGVLVEEVIQKAEKAQAAALLSPPAGQAVGMMTAGTTVRSVMYQLLSELAEAVDAMDEVFKPRN